jgi:hypothetical protein
MPRKTDKDKKVYFQMDRFVQQNGEWFYDSREGVQRGPFETREDAEADLVFYILECHKKDNFNCQ